MSIFQIWAAGTYSTNKPSQNPLHVIDAKSIAVTPTAVIFYDENKHVVGAVVQSPGIVVLEKK